MLRQRVIPLRVVAVAVDAVLMDLLVAIAIVVAAIGGVTAALPDWRSRQHLVSEKVQTLEMDPDRTVSHVFALAIDLFLLQLGSKCVSQSFPFGFEYWL